ncbi:phosphatase PAP2 family protein [Roseibium sp. SCP14]|uniref:phosphatase PAP2 family protein n=1 Tax=Roseibium sp. SCP14 TaxID=3141375 RepID=UPI00333AD61B
MNRNYHIKERINLQISVISIWIFIYILSTFSRLEINFQSFSYIFYISASFYAIALLMILIKDKYVAPIAEILGAGFAVLVPALIATYLAYSLDFPLADRQLVEMDRALGFDWIAFIRFVDSSHWLSIYLELAYASLKVQLVFVPVLLCCIGQVPRAIAYIFGYALMILVASTLAIPFPALGTYSYYDFDVTTLQNIDAKFGYHFLDAFNALRNDPSFILSGDDVVGIVTFPSVHAGMGFFTIWALWRTSWIKWPALVLNLSMAMSAVSHANHYLVDVMAGLGIAVLVALTGSYVFLGFGPKKLSYRTSEVLTRNSRAS